VDILEKRGPKEPHLKYLGNGLGGASMSSTWRVVTMGNHTLNLLLREAVSINAIFAQLE